MKLMKLKMAAAALCMILGFTGCSSNQGPAFETADGNKAYVLQSNDENVLRVKNTDILASQAEGLNFQSARFIQSEEGLFALMAKEEGGSRLIRVNDQKKIEASQDLDCVSDSDIALSKGIIYVLNTEAEGIEIFTYDSASLEMTGSISPELNVKDDISSMPISMAADENYIYVQIMQGTPGAKKADNLVYVLDYFGNLANTIKLDPAPDAFYGQMSNSPEGIMIPKNAYKDLEFEQASVEWIKPDGTGIQKRSMLLLGSDVTDVKSVLDNSFLIIACQKPKGYPGLQYSVYDLNESKEIAVELQEELGDEAQALPVIQENHLLLCGQKAIVDFDFETGNSVAYDMKDLKQLNNPVLIIGAQDQNSKE